jgi:hypothetical protein
MEDSDYIINTGKWFKEFIIKENICPFAAAAFLDKKVGFEVLKSSANFDKTLEQKIQKFVSEEWEKWTTFFFILPFLKEYDVFLEVFYLAEEIAESHADFPMHLVAFHPNHKYENVDENDTVNFANRSPFPLIQILKKTDLDQLNLSQEEKDTILERNEDLFRNTGFENLVKTLDEYRR